MKFCIISEEHSSILFYSVVTGSASVALLLIIVITACVVKRWIRSKVKINHSSTQTYNIEADQYEEIDEDQIVQRHVSETADCDNIQETNVDIDYEQPVDPLSTDRSDNIQLNESSSNSESSENETDENDTFTKDIVVNSYEQLIDNPEQPLPYDALNK